MFDVVVVGAGLAGTTCALALAKRGLAVGLAGRGWGASANFAGQLALGASPVLAHEAPTAWGARASAPAREVAAAPWTGHVRDIVGHEPLHPYALVGSAGSQEALARALALLQPTWAACDVAATPELTALPPVPWPTASGALAPVYAAHSPWAGGGNVVALDFVHAGVRMGPRAVAGWQHDAARWGISLAGARSVEVPAACLQEGGRLPEGALALARAMDRPGFVAAIAAATAPLVAGAGAKVVVVPAVLGLQQPAAVRATLAAAYGCPVVEALADAPHLPGIRLMQALAAQAHAAHVTPLAAVANVQWAHERPTQLHLEDGQQLTPRACVLATGRFIGGGLQWPVGGRCKESAWQLPVITDGGPIVERSPMELTRRRPEEQQPLARAGVLTDAQLRPYDGEGRVVPQLWAAGIIVGGYAPSWTACSDGVALVTGQAAADAVATALDAQARRAGGAA